MAVREAWLKPRTVSDGQTREDTRLSTQVGMSPQNATTAASGIRVGAGSGAAPFDLQSVSAMVAKVTPGVALVQGTTAQGAYPVYSDSDKNLTFADGHATNPRIDLVCLRVWDNFVDSSGSTMTDIVVVAGTPASSPVAPALPSTSSLALWEVRVNAGVSAGNGGIASNPTWSSARTDRRVYTAAAGGIRPATGGWNGTYDGQYRDNGTDLQRWYSGSSKWNAPYGGMYIASAYSDLDTVGLSGGPWRLNDSVLTPTWSSNRRYLIQGALTMMAATSPPNGAYLEIRYKTGSSIPNDQNPSSSTLLRRRHVGFSAEFIAHPVFAWRIYEPSVTEVGTIALFWTHESTGTTMVNGGIHLIVQDIGPQ